MHLVKTNLNKYLENALSVFWGHLANKIQIYESDLGIKTSVPQIKTDIIQFLFKHIYLVLGKALKIAMVSLNAF